MKTSIVLGVIIVFLIGTGWVLNLVALAKSDFKDPYFPEVIRAVGVFVPPVGAVVGFMDLEGSKDQP